MSLAVTSNGRQLKTGDSLNSGDPFRLSVNLPQLSYLYVVIIDSTGIMSRLYPSELTGTDNPVRGFVEIPTDPSSTFSLDNHPGTERLLIFAQQDRSLAIESILKEVQLEGGPEGQSRKVRALTRSVYVRKNLQQQSQDNSDKVSSSLGMASIEFVIEHH